MVTLTTPHKLALLATALLAVGSLGPWTTGVWKDDPIFGETTYTPRTTYAGQPLLVLAVVAAIVLLVVPSAAARAIVCSIAFGLAGLWALYALLDPGMFDIRIFSGWSEVHAGWGAGLAFVASVVGLGASVLGRPRRDPWKGAPF